jgi:hypothetical protein
MGVCLRNQHSLYRSNRLPLRDRKTAHYRFWRSKRLSKYKKQAPVRDILHCIRRRLCSNEQMNSNCTPHRSYNSCKTIKKCISEQRQNMSVNMSSTIPLRGRRTSNVRHIDIRRITIGNHTLRCIMHDVDSTTRSLYDIILALLLWCRVTRLPRHVCHSVLEVVLDA